MKICENRPLSFVIIGLIYLCSGVSGILMYLSLPFSWWVNLFLADVFSTVIVFFFFSMVLSNASVYDPYWSVQPIVILQAFSFGRSLTLFGILLLIVVWLWGLRLTLNWAYTFSDLRHQDWRYSMLEEKTGSYYPAVNLLGIHLFPTVVVYLCTVPAVTALREGYELSFGGLCLLISFLGFFLQSVSDLQMHRFRRRGSGGFIRDGLWKFSRHPNYLGEILMWWGIAFAVFFSNGRWEMFVGAAVNHLMFSFVSVPLADGRQSRKAGFPEYKQSTRMLLPFKK